MPRKSTNKRQVFPSLFIGLKFNFRVLLENDFKSLPFNLPQAVGTLHKKSITGVLDDELFTFMMLTLTARALQASYI